MENPGLSLQACQHGLNYDEAVAFCVSASGRLCTATELEAGCTRGTGCQHDADLVWSSTPGVGSGVGACTAVGSEAEYQGQTINCTAPRCPEVMPPGANQVALAGCGASGQYDAAAPSTCTFGCGDGFEASAPATTGVCTMDTTAEYRGQAVTCTACAPGEKTYDLL